MKLFKNILFLIILRLLYKYSKNPLDNFFYKSFLIKIPLTGNINLKPMKSIFD